jgi:hypothetical protein
MRKNWLLIGVALLAAVLAVAAIACDDDEDGDGNGDAVPPATEEGAAPDDGAEDGAAEDGGPITLILSALGGSAVTGSATLAGIDPGTAVIVTIDSGLEEGTHVNHIHEGTCDAIGDIGEPLESLEAGADGSAPAITTMTGAELQHLLDEDHVIAVHALDPATIVACGLIGGS